MVYGPFWMLICPLNEWYILGGMLSRQEIYEPLFTFWDIGVVWLFLDMDMKIFTGIEVLTR
jgi:hypothetical protein